MKLHRSVAPVLAGWFLMLPPLSHTLRLKMNSDLATWDIHSTHASVSECEQERSRLQSGEREKTANGSRSSLRRGGQDLMATRYDNSRCVSADDSSLRSK
jgi:hypothetical protein